MIRSPMTAARQPADVQKGPCPVLPGRHLVVLSKGQWLPLLPYGGRPRSAQPAVQSDRDQGQRVEPWRQEGGSPHYALHVCAPGTA